MISFIIIGCILSAGTSLELPEYLVKCSRLDPNFSSCLVKNAMTAIEHIKSKGDVKYQLNSLKPIKYDKLNLQATPRLRVDLANVEILGMDNIIIKEIQFSENKLSIKCTLERGEVIGDYDIKGQILVLPINGNGKINLTLANIEGVYTADIEQVTVGNDQFYHIKDDKMKLDLSRLYYDLTNLFNGDERLGSEMNKFLNENWRDVYGEVRETISSIVASIFNVYISGYFKNIPINKIIQD